MTGFFRQANIEKRLPTLIGLFIITAAGFYLRMIPVLNNPTVDFQWDGALHFRLCQQAASPGGIPEVDPLRLYPQGLNLKESVPTFMFGGYRYFDGVAKALFGMREVKTRVLCYNALCGALIGIPIFWAVFAVTGSRAPSLWAALLGTTLPLGVRRTFAVYLRPEVLGVLWMMMFFACFIRAVCAADEKQSRRQAILSALFLCLAVGTWRVAILFFIVLAVAVLVMILRGREVARLASVYGIAVAGFAASCVLLPYMRAQTYLLSYEALFIFAVAGLAGAVCYTARSGGEPSKKTKAVIVAYAVALFGVAAVIVRPDPHITFSSTSISVVKLALSKLGFGPIPLLPEDRLFGNAKELEPITFLQLLRSEYLSAASALILLYLCWVYLRRKRDMAEPTRFILFFLLMAFSALMLVVASRNMTVVAPLSAMAMGLAIHDVLCRIRSTATEPHRVRDRLGLAHAVIACIAVISAMSASQRMMTLRGSGVQMSSDLKKVLELFDTNTAKGSVIAADWQYGYPIQAYGHRATIVDGLFEVPEIRRRVLEQVAALWSAKESDLVEYCKKYDAAYILVGRAKLSAPVAYLGLRWKDYMKGDAPTPLGKQINLIRMFYDPAALTRFKPLIQNKEFSVFYLPEVAGRLDDALPPARPPKPAGRLPTP